MIDIVDRETALLLQSKGFKWNFHKKWGSYGYHKDYNDINPYDLNTPYNIPAPTISEVKRWIAKTYKIHIFAIPVNNIYYGYIVNYDKRQYSSKQVKKKTEQEVLILCIKKILKND